MRTTALILALVAGLAYAPAAFAHASLIRAEPADGAMVRESPDVLRLTFNEPVTPLVIRIVGPGGEAIVPAVAAENAVVTVTPPKLRNGTHVLSWRVISADGHPVGGSLMFSVGAPSENPGAQGAETDVLVRIAIWIAKLVLYIGLFVGVGGVFFATTIADMRPLPARAEPWIAGAMAVSLVAVVASVPLQGLDAMAQPLPQIWRLEFWAAGLRTSYGLTAAIAALALLMGLAAIRIARKSLAKWLAMIALAEAGLALAVSGHAGAAEPWLLSRLAVFLHGLCVAIWLGSLLPLVALVRAATPGDRSLARFSRAIPFVFAVLIATGSYLAFVQLDRIDALWTTSYGLVLSGKLAAILVLFVLAATNRYVLVPRYERGGAGAFRPLAASIVVELAVAFVILGIVALWRFTPPPRALAATEQIAFHIHGERAMLNAALEPARTRGARLDLVVLDSEVRPLAVKEVTLVLSNPAAGIEPVRRPAVNVGDATWRIDDLRIPLKGRWNVRVEILISDFEKVAIDDDIDLPRAP